MQETTLSMADQELSYDSRLVIASLVAKTIHV